MSSTSLASNRINTIYRDDSGVIWLGNFKKGVSYYHESFHEFIDTQHKECGDIASILEDKAGNIWLGTDGNGLYVKEKQKGFAIRKLSIPDIAIISLSKTIKDGFGQEVIKTDCSAMRTTVFAILLQRTANCHTVAYGV